MKSVRTILLVALTLLVVLVPLAGCAKQEEAPPTPVVKIVKETVVVQAEPEGVVLQGVKPFPGERYVMVNFLSGIEFWVPAREGMDAAGAMLGVETVYQGTELYDAQAEATVLEQVIASKPTGIIVTAQQPEALRPYIDQAIDAGIALVMFDSDSPASKRSVFLATDNYNAGAKAAMRMGELTGGKGSVGIITTPGQLNLDLRSQGFQDTLLKEFPNMRIIGECKGLGDYALAAGCASGFLQANEDMSGIFSTGSDGAPASVQAFREAGRLGEIAIIGFDIDQATIEGIEEGNIDATIVQAAWNMGYWGMMMVWAQAHDLTTLPAVVDTGVFVVDETNVAEWK